MLTALNEEGKLISLVEKRRNDLLRLREKQKFYCPICHDIMIMKAGEVRIPHFAHKKYSACSSAVTENETVQHLQGKKDLYTFFQKNKLDTKLEYYIPHINQRPDVFITNQGKHYAIEFQCSPISPALVEKRTNNYVAADIIPIWIVGGLPFQRKLSYSRFQLTAFLWSLTKRKDDQLVLISYRPENGHLYTLSQITSLTSRQAFAHLHNQQLQLIRPPFQLTKQAPQTFSFQLWKKERRKWLEQKVRFGHPHDPFLKAVYTSRNNPFLLPPLCGLPVPYMESFQSHPIEWQFYIWNDCLQKVTKGERISLRYVRYKIQTKLQLGSLIWRKVALESNENWRNAIRHYFLLLKKLGYLSKAGEELYKMNKMINAPNHIEEAMREEKALYELLQAKTNRSIQSFFLLD